MYLDLSSDPYLATKERDIRNVVDNEPLTREQRIDQLCDCMQLLEGDLRRLMNELTVSIENGLSNSPEATSSLKMLPSYLRSVPNGTEEGDFLALDLGGTNFRVLLVRLNGKDAKMEGRIFRLPEHIIKGTGTGLFDHIAECLAKFMADMKLSYSGRKLPLGFTFSFPCAQEGLTKARLITWTKGFSASGVESEDVVKLLREACHRRQDVDIDVVAILNDTVGTLMSCAFEDNSCAIGVIVGTGTNACYFEKIKRCHKLDKCTIEDDPLHDEMIINTEWGAFGDDGALEFIRTSFDAIVDEGSVNPGKQLFEKMISGMYMGELLRVMLVHLADHGVLFENVDYRPLKVPHSFPTKYVSEIEGDYEPDGTRTYEKTRQVLEDIGIEDAADHDFQTVAYVCSLVSRRAAELCAAGIATLMNRMQKQFVTVAIDGSVYRFHPTFHRILDETIHRLVNPNIKFQLMLSEDGSGRGAALVAAVASRLKEQLPNGSTSSTI
uniref:Phosphotransferase n=1 Tax=Parascaris univalens TaxID=6257 RepID=A0A915BB60_PARUN